MKKVSFIKGEFYNPSETSIIPSEDREKYFEIIATGYLDLVCTKSFTAEITVKIVPYEQV